MSECMMIDDSAGTSPEIATMSECIMIDDSAESISSDDDDMSVSSFYTDREGVPYIHPNPACPIPPPMYREGVPYIHPNPNPNWVRIPL